MTCSAVIRDSSSFSVNITRPDWLNTHTPPALIMRNVSPPCLQFNVGIMLRYFGKYAKRVSVTEPEESDFPDKLQRDGSQRGGISGCRYRRGDISHC